MFGKFAILSAIGVLSFSAASHALPSSLPVLAKRTKETFPSGKTRSYECVVHPDGVVITHVVDGIMMVKEKSFSLQTAITAKIDAAAGQSLNVSTSSPMGMTYEQIAFRDSSSGIRESVVLWSVDDKGQSKTNPSSEATVLREVLKVACE